MFWIEKKIDIRPKVNVQSMADIFTGLASNSPMVFSDMKNIILHEFTIRQISKFRASEKSIDVEFSRRSKKYAEMFAKVKMQFIGKLDIPYEVNITVSMKYENKFTFDCYVKDAIWTFIYSSLVTTDELTRLYPDGMKIPSELYVDDKIQPTLKLISKNN